MLRMLFILLLIPVWGIAQSVRLVNSTRQSWTGGVAGRMGARYTFSVEFTGYKKPPVADSIWIGDHPVPLNSDPLKGQVNMHTSVSRKKLRLEISAGTSTDTHADTPVGDEHSAPAPPRHYFGIALLSWYAYGRRHYFVIDRIITTYPPVSYP